MVKSDKDYLELARQLARQSNCKKIHYGAIIVKDGLVLGRGFNQPVNLPEDMGIKCCLRVNIESGTRTEQCLATHAEEVSVLNSLALGFNIEDASLYLAKESSDGKILYFDTSIICCSHCSRILYYMKIKEVIVGKTTGIEHVSINDVIKLAYEKLGVMNEN